MRNFVLIKKSQDYKNYCKVRDHCHYTGKYRAAADSISNLKYKVPKFVPVLFYNGSIYNNHLMIKKLAEDCNG